MLALGSPAVIVGLTPKQALAVGLRRKALQRHPSLGHKEPRGQRFFQMSARSGFGPKLTSVAGLTTRMTHCSHKPCANMALYQLHGDGSIWQFQNNTWVQLDNNSQTRIVARGGTFVCQKLRPRPTCTVWNDGCSSTVLICEGLAQLEQLLLTGTALVNLPKSV